MENASLFSWFLEPIETPQKTLSWLRSRHINRLYQFAAPTYSSERLSSFVKTAQHFDVDVYFLNGEPEWALDTTGYEMIQYIEWVQINYPNVKGIVFDIEPYLLQEYKVNPQKVMATFVKAMVKVYQETQKAQLEIILCIPYFYDLVGFKRELDTLIKEACDGIAVMNYYRDKEIEHIQTEVQLCARYHKNIETIYELQPPGEHDLTDQNTYFRLGLQAAYENYAALQRAYPNKKINLSFHEFRYFKELAERALI